MQSSFKSLLVGFSDAVFTQASNTSLQGCIPVSSSHMSQISLARPTGMAA